MKSFKIFLGKKIFFWEDDVVLFLVVNGVFFYIFLFFDIWKWLVWRIRDGFLMMWFFGWYRLDENVVNSLDE